MSKIDFRTGDLLGRLGGMVGGIWKGIPYVRKMVIPANPNTAAQQGVRTVFGDLANIGKRINSMILKDWTIPKPKKQSGFNKFIAVNKEMIDAGVFDYTQLVIADGGLFMGNVSSAIKSISPDQVIITWPETIKGEALHGDNIIIVVYNQTRDTYEFGTTSIRSDLSETIAIEMTDINDVIHTYLFPVQGDVISGITQYTLATE